MNKLNTQYYIAIILLLIIPGFTSAQNEPVGPGTGGFDSDFITGKFKNWNRKATPVIVLRVHGAGKLQTFSDISDAGEFKLPLPEIPDEGNYGSLTCGSLEKGLIVVVSDFSLLTTLPGFTSPGKWDKGYSVIGMALFADEKFSKNIGKPGGKRANWLYSKAARTVEAGECNNTNKFKVEKGWNAFTIISGSGGGPHTYKPGLDEDLGWYWYAFPEDINKETSSDPEQNPDQVENPDQQITGEEIQSEWLPGEWDGVQQDVQIEMHLKSSGNVWLESIEGGRKKTLEGKWSLNNNAFSLDIKEGVLQFNIEKISETKFRLFGRDAETDILFTRRK